MSRRGPIPQDKAAAAELIRREWEAKWSSPQFKPPWAIPSAPREIVESVASGWLPAQGRVLDIGCGTGEIVTWFAERGYSATGIDIARSAILRATQKSRDQRPTAEFIALDLCAATLPDRQFDILIDRGCLHQVPANLQADFVQNVCAMASSAAKMILLMAAPRPEAASSGQEVARHSVEWARRALAGQFVLERSTVTDLGANPAQPLPGHALWLTRC